MTKNNQNQYPNIFFRSIDKMVIFLYNIISCPLNSPHTKILLACKVFQIRARDGGIVGERLNLLSKGRDLSIIEGRGGGGVSWMDVRSLKIRFYQTILFLISMLSSLQHPTLTNLTSDIIFLTIIKLKMHFNT